MTAFVFACIAPHGAEIVEELSGSDAALMARTRRALQTLGRAARDAAVDTLVILTPHGTRVDGQFAIANSERMRGEVESHGAVLRMERGVNRDLAVSIAQTAGEEGLPVALVNFGTSDGPFSVLPLDWGAVIPLEFMPDVPVVVINPPRGTDFTPHLRFGAALGRAVAASGQRVGLIASCDWAHTHAPTGPYGHHEAASRLDARVVDLISRRALEDLASFDPQFVEDAKPDGLWQTLVLAGAVPPASRRIEVLSYEAPTYFGLLCVNVLAGSTQHVE